MKTAPVTRRGTETKSIHHSGTDGWRVELHNCDCHTFESVIDRLIYALGCSCDEAYKHTRRADAVGKTTVFSGTQEECDVVADKLAEIGLRTTVTQ